MKTRSQTQLLQIMMLSMLISVIIYFVIDAFWGTTRLINGLFFLSFVIITIWYKIAMALKDKAEGTISLEAIQVDDFLE